MTERVAADISNQENKSRCAKTSAFGQLEKLFAVDPVKAEAFVRFARKGCFGAGEGPALAVALNRSCRLAMEDQRAIGR